TAKTRRSGVFKAASMARRVAGLPALIGAVTPGNSTKSLSGRTGRVSRSFISVSLNRTASLARGLVPQNNQILGLGIPRPACLALSLERTLAQRGSKGKRQAKKIL